MSAGASDGWIEGEFEGIYSGEQRTPLTPRDPARARRFGFQLESGKLRAVLPSEAPDPELLSADVIRQPSIRRVELPTGTGAAAAGETRLFDVHISNWRLEHPAEAGGRAYGTIIGTLRARLRPQVQTEPEPDAWDTGSMARPSKPAGDAPRSRSSRVESTGVRARVARLLFASLIVLLALLALAIGATCSPRVAAIWGAPVVAALLGRRLTATRLALSGWAGAALCAFQLSLIWTPLQLAWQAECWPALGTLRMVGLGLPVLLAAALGSRWPVWTTGALWTVVVCSACASLGEGTCAAPATLATASARQGPVARTDPDGRWPVMPQVAFPPSGGGAAPVSDSDREGVPVVLPAPGGGTGSPGDAPRSPQWSVWPAPQQTRAASGTPSDAPHSAELPSDLPIPMPPDTRPGTDAAAAGASPRISSTEGGWVSPDHRRAPRELVLISIEQANRTPRLFFEGEGTRRVYVPTDPIFDQASSRLRPRAELVLARIAALLSLPSQPQVVLEVHSDSAGALENQVAQSQRRAATVRDWLVQRGHVDPQRFELVSIGGARPLVPPDGDYGAQRPNRRIEIRLADD